MPRYFLFFLILLLAGCAIPVGLVDQRPGVSVKQGYTVTGNIVYTPANRPEPVLGDLYRPQTTRPAPAVLLVHGGGWTGKDGRWQMR